jgi:hypothetical protein
VNRRREHSRRDAVANKAARRDIGFRAVLTTHRRFEQYRG